MTEFNAQAARAKRPCPLWVDAFQRDTQHLEADEVGAYMLILMAMWTRESCDFPADDKRLARVSRVSTRLWNSRVGPVIRAFLEEENGVIISKRLRKEATYVERQVTQQSDRKTGQKSGKVLKTNKQGQSTDTTTDKPRHYPSQQPNNPTLKEKDKSSSFKTRGVEEADFYQRYFEAHPDETDSDAGRAMFEQLVAGGEDPEAIIASAAAYAEKAAGWSTEAKVQRADNFLDPKWGKWREHIPKPKTPPATDEAKIKHWADMVSRGVGFGLERQMAEHLVEAELITRQQLSEARGYNG